MDVKKIAVIRFSAMGDVMLLVPVLRSLTAAYPDLEVTLVTRPRFASFFRNIHGVKVFEADVDFRYNGVLGMRDLFRDLMRRRNFDMVFDLHDHIRTMILRTFFKLLGIKVLVFEKGRKEKKALTKKENKETGALPHTVDRYYAVFEKAGFAFPRLSKPHLTPDDAAKQTVSKWLADQQITKNEKWIGVAPFAMHLSKIWPSENYAPLLRTLLQKIPARFFFFGGGEKEIRFFEELKEQFPDHCTLVAGQLKIRHEIALLPSIDLMLCVDSSNMHLAALTGTPLLAIWGGTHPDAGFGPYQYDQASILQIDREQLPCRPYSVYGKATCYRGDFACMHEITVDRVADEIVRRLA